MPDRAIGLMAKYAEFGKVKSRLAADIGHSRALKVYRQLLQRAVRVTCNLDGAEYFRVSFVMPESAVQSFRQEYAGFDLVTAQHGDDLGERMLNAFMTLSKTRGIGKSYLIGADIPEIDGQTITTANELLDKNDLVLGPTLDGGYYLIGLKKVCPELFAGIEWGTNKVFQQTMTVAVKKGMTVGLLPELRDLDDLDDFNYFVKRGLLSETTLR
jgi:rSAM/selenodomain-associated transferase 1